MNRDPLAMPVWHSLATDHQSHGMSQGGMRRYRPEIACFIAADAPEPEADPQIWCPHGARLVFLQHQPPRLPAGLSVIASAEAVQMVADAAWSAPETGSRADISRLGSADIGAMLALAERARPGPITRHALELGRFWGIRQDGELIAMAGERFSLPGFVEVSGVCTDPRYRGRGLGRLLSLHVADAVRQSGRQPFLHAYASNSAAIRLYESIGFRQSRSMVVTVIENA